MREFALTKVTTIGCCRSFSSGIYFFFTKLLFGKEIAVSSNKDNYSLLSGPKPFFFQDYQNCSLEEKCGLGCAQASYFQDLSPLICYQMKASQGAIVEDSASIGRNNVALTCP